MKKLFWGALLIFLSFDLEVNGHSVDVLPSFAGYILMLQGMKTLEHESEKFRSAQPFAVGMAVYTGILWVGDLLAVAGGGWIAALLGLTATVAALYIAWLLIQGVAEMERSHGADLRSGELLRYWKALAILQAASKVLGLMANLDNLPVIFVVVAVLGVAVLIWNILYLMTWWQSAQAYEAMGGEEEPSEEETDSEEESAAEETI